MEWDESITARKRKWEATEANKFAAISWEKAFLVIHCVRMGWMEEDSGGMLEDVSSFCIYGNLRRMHETRNNNNNDNKLFDLCYDFCYYCWCFRCRLFFCCYFGRRMLECMRLFVRLSMKLFIFFCVVALCIDSGVL